MTTKPTGQVEGIIVRPGKRAPVIEVQSWLPGSDRDHGRGREHRAVTLIQSEHIPVISKFFGQEISWKSTRRNVLVSGINLLSLVGRQFQIGEAVLEGTEPCDPCAQMEKTLGKGGKAAMSGMGGLCARIVTPGVIEVGAAVTVLEDAT